MPIGKLTDEDRRRLDEHFWSIVTAACKVHRCWRGEVLNRHRKSRKTTGISAARRMIVAEMRRTAFTYYSHTGQCNLWLGADIVPSGAIPISFPLLGRMIGVDHSALVLGQQQLKKLKENHHA